MSTGKNKQRIYFCVYFQQGPTGTRGNPPVFHCGLWVEEKKSRGGGDFFHVQFHTRPANRPDYPHGWVYDTSVTRNRRANWRHSGALIGRMLLGKLRSGVTAQHIHDLCRNIPLPRGSSEENCWDWTFNAIRAIQDQGWLEDFSLSGRNGFRTKAYNKAIEWINRDPRMEREHNWDPFGVEQRGSHCAVM